MTSWLKVRKITGVSKIDSRNLKAEATEISIKMPTKCSRSSKLQSQAGLTTVEVVDADNNASNISSNPTTKATKITGRQEADMVVGTVKAEANEITTVINNTSKTTADSRKNKPTTTTETTTTTKSRMILLICQICDRTRSRKRKSRRKSKWICRQ